MPDSATSAAQSVGVHYTPDYVVDYIVAGVLAHMPARALTLVDPACGDGAFLLGAARGLAAGRSLNVSERGELAIQQLFGVDLDAAAVEIARQRLAAWIAGDDETQRGAWAARLASNLQAGDALIGLDWPQAFPGVFAGGGFGCVLGNPPYRRELDFRARLAEIAATPWGRRHCAPRMDLWYYFVHRGLEILRPGGRLAFVTSAYWTGGRGAARLIAALQQTHVEELFALDTLPIFPGVSGRHLIFRVAKDAPPQATQIRRVRRTPRWARPETYFGSDAAVDAWQKEPAQLFRHGSLDLEPAADGWLSRFERFATLGSLGLVRQGIAENPAKINAKTAARHGDHWLVGTGVFVLTPDELAAMELTPAEQQIVRPYHTLADVGRYRLGPASQQLIYATRETWPTLDAFPRLAKHLEQFRPVLEARREVRLGRIAWWHLHWPRDPALWARPKLAVLQLGRRPGCVLAPAGVCVPFTLNVWAPSPNVREDLRYFCGVYNSAAWWKWLTHHAKSRGAGLEVNGHVLARTPAPRINFEEPNERQVHEAIVELVASRLECTGSAEQERLESEIEALVERLIDA
jgi:hypothetical protein